MYIRQWEPDYSMRTDE